MGKIIYITGGTRSGKSEFAEGLINKRYKRKIYLATAKRYDDEMKERIYEHRKRRDDSWKTMEGYKGFSTFFKEDEEREVVLLDCLTNMVSNLVLEDDLNWEQVKHKEKERIGKKIDKEVEELITFFKNSHLDLVVVSNELGWGLVPAYPLGRYFRDIAGLVNQRIARESCEGYMVVSGIEIRLK